MDDKWIDGEMNKWTGGQMIGWMDGQKGGRENNSLMDDCMANSPS